jgi:hydroxyacylglutathione hydrolase
MLLKQYYLECLAHASYLLGDEETGTAIVVDPQRDIDQYLADAQAHGLQIRHVFLTHFHADFVAGHLELRERTGAQIYLGVRAEAEYDFTPMGDGSEVRIGSILLRSIETPGHTPESICILVYDTATDAERPHAVLTGDTLFIGDVGRPDLGASVGWKAEDLASMLYESLHGKLLPKVIDETLVYPAHGAGSMCGRSLSEETFSTVGNQRRYNYALQDMSRDAFVEMVTADQPEAPAYFSYDAEMNTRERAILDENLAENYQGLSLDEVLSLQSEGAQILDVRDGEDFAGAHLKNSVNVALDGRYASWAGTVLDSERPIVIIAAPGDEQEAAMRLGRIGFDNVLGYLQDGMLALASRSDLLARVARITARDLQEWSGQKLWVLDVRTANERAQVHIPGSENIPLNRLRQDIEEVPKDQPVAVYCAGGYRSSVAASLLMQQGLQVYDIVGGVASWQATQEAAG